MGVYEEFRSTFPAEDLQNWWSAKPSPGVRGSGDMREWGQQGPFEIGMRPGMTQRKGMDALLHPFNKRRFTPFRPAVKQKQDWSYAQAEEPVEEPLTGPSHTDVYQELLRNLGGLTGKIQNFYKPYTNPKPYQGGY